MTTISAMGSEMAASKQRRAEAQDGGRWGSTKSGDTQ